MHFPEEVSRDMVSRTTSDSMCFSEREGEDPQKGKKGELHRTKAQSGGGFSAKSQRRETGLTRLQGRHYNATEHSSRGGQKTKKGGREGEKTHGLFTTRHK